jgi:hypothetical protein
VGGNICIICLTSSSDRILGPRREMKGYVYCCVLSVRLPSTSTLAASVLTSLQERKNEGSGGGCSINFSVGRKAYIK